MEKKEIKYIRMTSSSEIVSDHHLLEISFISNSVKNKTRTKTVTKDSIKLCKLRSQDIRKRYTDELNY